MIWFSWKFRSWMVLFFSLLDQFVRSSHVSELAPSVRLSVSQWVTTWLATQRSDPLGGPGWASEVGPLSPGPCVQIQSVRCAGLYKVYNRSSETQLAFAKHNLKMFWIVLYYLDSLELREEQICHEMLAAVSISLPFQSFCSPLPPCGRNRLIMSFKSMVDDI